MGTAILEKAKNLNKYAGQWVAFRGKEIVAANETLKGLMAEIDSRGLRKKVSVFLVPRKDEGPYVLIFEGNFLNKKTPNL